MSKRRTLNSMVILVIVCVVCVALILISSSNRNTNVGSVGSLNAELSSAIDAGIPSTALPTITAGTTPTIQATSTVEVINRRYILDGKSLEEIGQFTANYIAPSFLGSTITPTVLLASSVTREEVPQLGLGCLPDNVSSEEPPYVLVVLQGDFNYVGRKSRFSIQGTGNQYHYAAVIVDVWAAAPTVLIGLENGAEFRTALNNHDLPQSTGQFPVNCPPRTPGTLPYGAVLPGVVFPTAPPAPTTTVQTTVTVPQPIPTPEVP